MIHETTITVYVSLDGITNFIKAMKIFDESMYKKDYDIGDPMLINNHFTENEELAKELFKGRIAKLNIPITDYFTFLNTFFEKLNKRNEV